MTAAGLAYGQGPYGALLLAPQKHHVPLGASIAVSWDSSTTGFIISAGLADILISYRVICAYRLSLALS